MQKNKLFSLSLILVGFGLFACKKGELPVPLPDKGGLTTSSVDITPTYKYQVYFDFGTNSNVGSNLKSSWDLGFSCKAGSKDIILNTSKIMFVYPVYDQTFDEISDTIGFSINKTTDLSSGFSDELAMFEHNLFIVDKGMNENGIMLGFFKVEILSNTDNEVVAKFANINGTSEETVTIQKNDAYNFTFVNWQNGLQIIDVEPPKATWDIVFTQYTHIFYEPELTPYLVTGCLNNSYNTMCAEVQNVAFDAIDLPFAQTQLLQENRDLIGYDWKVFDGTTYTIDTEKMYVILDSEGYYYKLRFIDFYTESGEKGSPKFEFEKL